MGRFISVDPPCTEPQLSAWRSVVRRLYLLTGIRGYPPSETDLRHIASTIRDAVAVLPLDEFGEFWGWVRGKRMAMIHRWSKFKSRYFNAGWWPEIGEMPSEEIRKASPELRKAYRLKRKVRQ